MTPAASSTPSPTIADNVVSIETVELLATSKMHTPKSEQHAQWTGPLVFVGYASTLGTAVPVGYCTGVMNSPALHMRAWCNETLIERYDMHLSHAGIDLLWSAIVSIFLVGGAIGSLTGAIAADRFGRRGCNFICAFLLLLGALCFFTCRMLSSVELLLIGRLLVGLASGLATACLPMYHSEIAALEQRDALSVFCPVGMTAGVVVAQIFSLQTVFGSADKWHIALSFYGLLVILCYAPLNCYAESPKWLYVLKGRRGAAEKQLKRLRGSGVSDQLIAAEIANMEIEAQQKTKTLGFWDVLGDKKLTMPLIIVCAYLGGQQLSGINAIFYYSVSIFRKAGLSLQAAEWANLGAGSLNLVIALLGPLLMARLNRRFLMQFSTFFCAIFLFLFAIMLNFIENISWFAVGCIACIFLYIFFFQFGVGPIPFFIGTELFELAPRSVAMSIGSLIYWICNFIVGMTFPTLQNAWGAFVFLPCSFTCVLMFLLTKYYLPETRGRDATVVAPLLANGFKSKVR